jgi:adenosylcobyric acid synthase
MLGRVLHDPAGIEGPPASVAGFGWLDMETTLEAEKRLANVQGTLTLAGTPAMRGYEIHMGISRGPALDRPAVFLAGRPEGARSADEQILGTYCHGLFDHPEGQRALLTWAGARELAAVDFAARREADLDRLADATEAALDWKLLSQWL